jgi:hypothetical protein
MAMGFEPAGQNPGKTVSLWEIERFLLGELPGPEAEALRRKIDASPELKSYLEKARSEAPKRTFADFQRFKAERLARESVMESRESAAEAGNARLAAPAAPRESFGLGDWMAGLQKLFHGPRLAYGFGFALLVGLTLWTFHPRQEAALESAHQAKGGDEMELLLKVGGQEVEAGESARARAGDTLSFLYRSPKAVHVQIGYREDGGDLVPFDPAGAAPSPWIPATRWTAAPQRILLEGAWKRQEVWVISGSRALSADEVKALVAGKPGDGKAYVFRLIQGEGPK